MGKPFSELTYDDAKDFFKPVTQPDRLTSLTRRSASAKSATAFFESDHWQNSKGFIGQLPPAGLPGKAEIEAEIKKGFVSENVIQEVVETHVGGILGREPMWSFLKAEGKKVGEKPPKDEQTGETLTPWWNDREALNSFQESAETVLLEGIAVRRLFIPKGRIANKVDGSGKLPAQRDLSKALDFIFFST